MNRQAQVPTARTRPGTDPAGPGPTGALPARPPAAAGQDGHDRGWVAPALVAAGWTLWAYLRDRPPASVAAGHLRTYARWSFAHLTHTDVVSLYRERSLFDHALPYVHVAIEYPVLTGLFMWGAAWAPGVQGYVALSALGLGACAVGCVWLLYRSSPRRAWLFALCPLLLPYAIYNWDLLAIVLMLAGWDAYRTRRHATAGVLLALGVFAKFFPVVLLAFCAAELWRERASSGSGPLERLAVGALVTSVVVNAPFALLNFGSWLHFFAFNARRTDRQGILFQLRIVSGWPVGAVDALSAAIVLGAVGFLGWKVVQGTARVEFAAAAAFAVLMLVNKAYSPQYMLWVFTFGLLADWPSWVLAVTAFAGLVDFVNAMMTLHLEGGPAWPWYWGNVFHLNLVTRNAAIATALGASAWQERRQWAHWRPAGAGAGRDGASPGVPVGRPARAGASGAGVPVAGSTAGATER